MPTNSEKIEQNTLNINTLERDFKNLREVTCPTCQEKIKEQDEEIETLTTKVSNNTREIGEVKNSVNLVAHEVKELIILRNKINTNMWRIILGIIVTLLLYLLTQNGSQILSKLLKVAGT